MATNTYSKSTFESHNGKRVSSNGGNPVTDYELYTWSNASSGVKLSDWKRRIKNNEDATTVFDASSLSLEHQDGHYELDLKYPGQPVTHRYAKGYIHPYFDPPPGFPSTLDASEASRDAQSQFYKEASKALVSIQSGVALGELRQTLSMIAGRGNSFKQLLNAWRTGLSGRRSRNGKSRSQRAADAWLEFQFGWRPLAADIRGALAAFRSDKTDVVSVSAFAKRDRFINRSIDPSEGSGISGILVKTEEVNTSSTKVKIRGGVKLTVPGHNRRLEKLGLVPHQFVPTLYELLPWSFLIDYFTDLGGTINALSFPSERLYYTSTSTVKELVRSWHTVQRNNFGSGGVVSNETFIPQRTVWRKKVVQRRPGTPDVPMPTVHLPQHWKQWANILALWISKDLRYTNLR